MTTPPTIPCNKWDVILVPFKFTDTDMLKPRPAVVVSVDQFHTSRADAIMLAVTSQAGRLYFGDCTIVDWQAAGLVKPSQAKGVLRTIERSLIHRWLGRLTPADCQRVEQSLRLIMGLP